MGEGRRRAARSSGIAAQALTAWALVLLTPSGNWISWVFLFTALIVLLVVMVSVAIFFVYFVFKVLGFVINSYSAKTASRKTATRFPSKLLVPR